MAAVNTELLLAPEEIHLLPDGDGSTGCLQSWAAGTRRAGRAGELNQSLIWFNSPAA